MAIFKILKGPSSRIDLSVTPFNEGYAYFTPDNNGFYIDAIDTNGEQKRFHINAASVAEFVTTLDAKKWAGGMQTVTVPGVTTDSKGVVGVTASVSDEQFSAAQEAALHLTEQGNGTVTISVMGETTPTIDIPIVFLLFE